MFFQIKKLAQANVLAAGFAQGADFLAQDIVFLVQLFILFCQNTARLDEGEVIPQLHERRAKLYENHAQLGRKTGRLAQEYDPAHHQQSDNDPISSVQTILAVVVADFSLRAG